jgi:hypothetical protein
LRQGVVVAGSLAQRPWHGGHAWALLQYLLGFRRLGYEVMFLDCLTADMVGGGGVTAHIGALKRTLGTFGLDGCYALALDESRGWAGVPRQSVLERVAASLLLLNVNGFLDDEELLDAAPLRVFLDIDPGFNQMWSDLGLAEPFKRHDRFVTVAGNLGRDDCSIPTCGLDWLHTPPPVVLEHWPVRPSTRRVVTSVAAWRGPFAPVEYDGRTYGLRVHEFRRFLDLPAHSPLPLELALEIDPSDARDLRGLREGGWRLADPRAAAGDPLPYRSYVQDSMAEVMIAKTMYVRSRSGWFSDRSACYLASGKPVLAQDTGLGWHDPDLGGLLLFSTLDEAAAGLEEIAADYDDHRRAARQLAEERFDSDVVLPELLAKLGVS